MPNQEEREDLNKIRHYKGSVADFKNFWDEMAGKNTNSYDTPAYQGFNNVHPIRGEEDSEHWKTSNLEETEVNEGMSALQKKVWDEISGMAINHYANVQNEYGIGDDANEMQEFIENLSNRDAKKLLDDIKKKMFESKIEEGRNAPKIACIECDEVNTKAKWKKNNGVCPSCNNLYLKIFRGRIFRDNIFNFNISPTCINCPVHRM